MDKLALAKPSTSVLSRTRTSPSLSPIQGQVDQLVENFVDQASDWKTLAAMTAGGLAYRWGRIGVMNLGVGAYCNTALRVTSIAAGLSAEVTAFEFTHRTLFSLPFARGGSGWGRTVQGNKTDVLPPPNPLLTKEGGGYWEWSGPGGWKEGLLSSFITFGALKGFGRLAQGQNPLLQHLFQDSGMVLGHQISHRVGLGPKPEGTMAEQFLHAEAVNLQLGAGTALGHAVTGGKLHALERGLDLKLKTMKERRTLPRRPPPAGEHIWPPLQPIFSGEETNPPNPPLTKGGKGGFLLMSSSNEGGGGRGPKVPADLVTHIVTGSEDSFLTTEKGDQFRFMQGDPSGLGDSFPVTPVWLEVKENEVMLVPIDEGTAPPEPPSTSLKMSLEQAEALRLVKGGKPSSPTIT